MNVTELRDATAARVSSRGVRWLDDGLEAVRGDPARIERLFPAVGRELGRGALDPGASPADPHAWGVDDAGRVLLLLQLGAAHEDLLEALYRHGDTAERRAVLRALPLLPIGSELAARVAGDALRTNDPRLVAAALVPYAADHFDTSTVHQAVLKCIFLGVPVGHVPEVRRRATPELTRMLDDFVLERVAAGRDVPADLWPLIVVAGGTALPRRLDPELACATPDRAAAAYRANAALRTATPPRS